MSLSGWWVQGSRLSLPDRGVAPKASTAEQQATSDYGSAVASPEAYNHQAAPSNLNVTPTHHEPESFTFPNLPLIAQSSSRPPTRHLKHSFSGDCLIPNTSQHGELAAWY